MTDTRTSGGNPLGGPFAFIGWALLVVVCIGFALLARSGVWFNGPRSGVDDALEPAREVVSAPFAAARRFSRSINDHFDIYEENQRLKEENERLRAWYDLALAMRDKMTRYEKLLGVNPDPAGDVVTARVVADTSGPFVRARLINAGAREGVRSGQAVLTERGLAGRVVAAGQSSARMLLLTDLNSRVPVMIERNDARAILAGDNRPSPRLEFLPRDHGVANGDRVVTSGDAGQLPRGLPVGEATVDPSGVWRVRLYAEQAPIDYVRVVRFVFPPSPEDDPVISADADADAGGGAEPGAVAEARAGAPSAVGSTP